MLISSEKSPKREVEINPRTEEKRVNGIRNDAKGRIAILETGLIKMSLLKYRAIIGRTLKEAATQTTPYPNAFFLRRK